MKEENSFIQTSIRTPQASCRHGPKSMAQSWIVKSTHADLLEPQGRYGGARGSAIFPSQMVEGDSRLADRLAFPRSLSTQLSRTDMETLCG